MASPRCSTGRRGSATASIGRCSRSRRSRSISSPGRTCCRPFPQARTTSEADDALPSGKRAARSADRRGRPLAGHGGHAAAGEHQQGAVGARRAPPQPDLLRRRCPPVPAQPPAPAQSRALDGADVHSNRDARHRGSAPLQRARPPQGSSHRPLRRQPRRDQERARRALLPGDFPAGQPRSEQRDRLVVAGKKLSRDRGVLRPRRRRHGAGIPLPVRTVRTPMPLRLLRLPALVLALAMLDAAFDAPRPAEAAGTCSPADCLSNSAVNNRVQPTTVGNDDKGDVTFFASQSGQLANVVLVLDNSTSMYELPYDNASFPNSSWVNVGLPATPTNGRTPNGCNFMGNAGTDPACGGLQFSSTAASCANNGFLKNLTDAAGAPYNKNTTYAFPD